MKATEFVIEYKKDRKAPKYSLKPRSPVAHAAQSVISGSGPHKDKKKAEKQGDVKHKNKQYAEGVAEARYDPSDDDSHDYGTDLLVTIRRLYVSARDGKSPSEQIKSLIRMKDGIAQSEEPRLQQCYDFLMKNLAGGAVTDPKMIMQIADKAHQLYHPSLEPIAQATREVVDRSQKQGMAERVRDPADWDEGNTEPPNNFAVYINGKKWKVFQGRGKYADDQREKAHYEQLKSWAANKSATTGKKWEVAITGEAPTA